MAKTDKTIQKLSNQITKDFTKLVKAFVRNAAKGGHDNIAFVVGYLDAATGTSRMGWSKIPENHFIAYSRGWQSGMEKEPAKRKTRGARL
jgi:hypothetical protein